MDMDDRISLYGKRGARAVARFRLDDPVARAKADEKVRQWTPWAYKFSNLYMKHHPRMARAIKLTGFTMDDVRQSALEGMTRASRVHEEDSGAFSAYSVWYMRKEIQRLIRRKRIKITDTDFNEQESPDGSPLESLMRSEQESMADDLLREIPSLYRYILIDHLNGVIQDETSMRFGLSKRTLKKYRLQALEWLRFFAGVGSEPDKRLPGMRYRGTGGSADAG